MRFLNNFSQILMLGFIALSLPFVACQNESKNAMKPLRLTEEQMFRLVKDVQLAEATLGFQRNIGKISDDQKDIYFDLIFKKNGLTPEIFEENLDFYNHTPEKLERIYDSVIVSLQRMQDTLKLDKGTQ